MDRPFRRRYGPSAMLDWFIKGARGMKNGPSSGADSLAVDFSPPFAIKFCPAG